MSTVLETQKPILDQEAINKEVNTQPTSPTIAQQLSHILADTYIVYVKTQNFHWNVRGSLFYCLHNLFEEQYQEIAIAIDDIAERIRTLGLSVPGSLHDFIKLSSISETVNIPDAQGMIKELVDAHQTLNRNIYSILKQAQTSGDEATVELLTQRMSAHQKNIWMLNSVLER